MGWYDVREGSPLKKSLAAGETVVGTFIRIPAVETAELSAHAGCDFVIVDAEHTPVGWERIAAMIVAAENAGTTPILRVSNPGRDLITRGLDAGAHGIMVPQVESAEMARAAMAASRYGPGGTRGTASSMRNGYGMVMSYGDYVAAANEATVVVLQVETAAGVEAVEEIAEVEGIDCLFIGLADLSVNLGHPGDFDHPEVTEHVDRVVAAAVGRGIAAGVPVSDHEMANKYIQRGVRLVAVGDVGVFAAGIRRFVGGVERSRG